MSTSADHPAPAEFHVAGGGIDGTAIARGGAPDLGRDIGGGPTQREVERLVAGGWADTGEDLPWRRSKRGLRAPEGTAAAAGARLAP